MNDSFSKIVAQTCLFLQVKNILPNLHSSSLDSLKQNAFTLLKKWIYIRSINFQLHFTSNALEEKFAHSLKKKKSNTATLPLMD